MEELLPKDKFETRVGKIVLRLPDEDASYFLGKIRSYLHLQNMIILIREELYRRAEPEKFFERFLADEDYLKKKAAEKETAFEPREVPALNFDPLSKAKYKTLLSYFSNHHVIRSLFQEQSDEKKLKTQKTLDAKLRKSDPEKLAKIQALRAKKEGQISAQARAKALKDQLEDVPIFYEFLMVGSELKSHVIMNLAKRLGRSYQNAFDNFSKTGVFYPPKTKKVLGAGAFFLDLCSNSVKIKKDSLSVNLDRKSKRIPVERKMFRGYEGVINEQFSQIGFEMGQIVFVFNYSVPRAAKDAPMVGKKAAGDLGIGNIISLFTDDEQTPSVVLRGKSIVCQNAKFNEQIAEISERLDPVKSALSKLRKVHGLSTFELCGESTDAHLLNSLVIELGQRRERFYAERRVFFHQTLHKLAKRILEFLQKNGVTEFYASKILGRLKQTGSNTGRKNRRRFHQIPIIKLVEYIELYAFEYGVTVKIINEAYSSKTNVFLNSVKINQETKAQLENLKDIDPVEAEKIKNSLGTTLGGRRDKGKFIVFVDGVKPKNRPYYHADVGGAANHIQAEGQAIFWTKKKIHKLFAPIKIDALKVLDQKHDGILGRRAA